MERKQFNIATYVDYDVICTAPKVEDEILSHLNQFTRGRPLLEIGCAEGDFGKRVDCT